MSLCFFQPLYGISRGLRKEVMFIYCDMKCKGCDIIQMFIYCDMKCKGCVIIVVYSEGLKVSY